MSTNLIEALADPARPTFLFGCVPPRDGTNEESSVEIAEKFVARGRVLALDGYIVYDVQDESSRTETPRPFPYRKLQDPSWFAGVVTAASQKQCIVYKAAPCVESEESFKHWLSDCVERDGHVAVNIVGAPSSSQEYKGPSTREACQITKQWPGVHFGCVSIAERHATKGTEHLALARKVEWGAEWFITQGIYDPEPMIRLLHDYSSLCKENGVVPKKIILTFTPCGRRKTMNFIKWLGMSVPPEFEEKLFKDENNTKRTRTPVEVSCLLLCENLRRILAQTAGCGVPIGLNVESVSGYRDEIDATHNLFRDLQAILLDATGSPWVMTWSRLPWSPRRRQLAIGGVKASEMKPVAREVTQQLQLYSPTELSQLVAVGAVAAGTSLVSGIVLGFILGRR